jgi:hypothetical protein
MVNYQNGKIYSIRSFQTNIIYIGSTTQKLSTRMAEHRSRFKKNKFYCTSYEILKYDDAYIELLENCPCENKEELYKREGELQRENSCVNERIAGRSDKQWRNDNKEILKKKLKDWKINNKDKIKEYQGRKIKCDICEIQIRYDSKWRHKKTNNHLKNQLRKEKLNNKNE